MKSPICYYVTTLQFWLPEPAGNEHTQVFCYMHCHLATNLLGVNTIKFFFKQECMVLYVILLNLSLIVWAPSLQPIVPVYLSMSSKPIYWQAHCSKTGEYQPYDQECMAPTLGNLGQHVICVSLLKVKHGISISFFKVRVIIKKSKFSCFEAQNNSPNQDLSLNHSPHWAMASSNKGRHLYQLKMLWPANNRTLSHHVLALRICVYCIPGGPAATGFRDGLAA